MGMRYAKLRGRIREKFGTQGAFAEAMDMHHTTLSRKLAGLTDWTREEMDRAAQLLGIGADELYGFFYGD